MTPVVFGESAGEAGAVAEQRSTAVLKIGGSSLHGVRGVRRAARLVGERAAPGEPAVLVVSALGGVTDRLQKIALAAAAGDPDALHAVDALARRHRELLESVSGADDGDGARQRLDACVDGLRDAVEEVLAAGRLPPDLRDEVLSWGERLSAPVVAAALRAGGTPARDRDARLLLVTNEEFGNARLDWPATRRAVRDRLRGREGVQVVPGFVGASAEGRTTTLGRGGSDLTAVTLAAALNAAAAEIFTDVDGVMTGDPRLVPDGRTVPSLSWDEMWVLSRFGARVLQARASWMAREAGVRLRVRRAAHPERPGTRIGPLDPEASTERLVGVTSSAPEALPWIPPVVSADGDAPTAGAEPVVDGGDEGGRGTVAVVGALGRPAAGRRLAAALEEASVHVLAERDGPARSLLLSVPADETARAAIAAHDALFGHPDDGAHPEREVAGRDLG